MSFAGTANPPVFNRRRNDADISINGNFVGVVNYLPLFKLFRQYPVSGGKAYNSAVKYNLQDYPLLDVIILCGCRTGQSK